VRDHRVANDKPALLSQNGRALAISKEQIVSEIRRTAKENGDRPLGQDRFLVETGIRIADWHGIYWARWGDALREAGFAPNEFQAAIPEDALLEKYVALIRELGHLPVKGELRLKRKTDSSFPNDKTFGRFGSKTALLAKVLQYCQRHSGYEDVIDLCAKALPAVSENLRHELDLKSSSAKSDGYVYLAKSGGHYKIGRSNSIGRREYELAIQLPEKLNLIHRIRTDDPVGIEAYWHERFAAKHANGEWFKLDAADVSAFKRRRSFM
jgi:hypothetical protein